MASANATIGLRVFCRHADRFQIQRIKHIDLDLALNSCVATTKFGELGREYAVPPYNLGVLLVDSSRHP